MSLSFYIRQWCSVSHIDAIFASLCYCWKCVGKLMLFFYEITFSAIIFQGNPVSTLDEFLVDLFIYLFIFILVFALYLTRLSCFRLSC